MKTEHFDELQRLRYEMRRLMQTSDIEYCHIEADKLLLDTIGLLMAAINEDEITQECIQIKEAFKQIDKWYA
jgi:hypothetical protein